MGEWPDSWKGHELNWKAKPNTYKQCKDLCQLAMDLCWLHWFDISFRSFWDYSKFIDRCIWPEFCSWTLFDLHMLVLSSHRFVLGCKTCLKWTNAFATVEQRKSWMIMITCIQALVGFIFSIVKRTVSSLHMPLILYMSVKLGRKGTQWYTI